MNSEIDPSILRDDHAAAACASIVFTTTAPTLARSKIHQLKQVDYDWVDWTSFDGQCSHELDVHSHLSILQQRLNRHLRQFLRPQPPQPQNATLSAATWQLAQEKKSWRKTLKDYNLLQKKTILQQIFHSWRQGKGVHLQDFDRLLRTQDQLMSGALWQFRRLGKLVTSAMRRDDRIFFAGLLADGAEFLSPGKVKDLWKVIRRSLPKFQQRRLGYAPQKLANLEGHWEEHFQQLEIGLQTTSEELSLHCTQASPARCGPISTNYIAT